MIIYIDADACPVTRLAVSIAKELSIKCVLVCDTAHEISIEGTETVIVSKGSDSADFALVNKLTCGDIAVTQDYGLASMCLAKRAYAINQNGLEYTSDSIIFLMESRHEAKKQRMRGVHLKGPKKRTIEQDAAFERSFRALIKRATDNQEI